MKNIVKSVIPNKKLLKTEINLILALELMKGENQNCVNMTINHAKGR